MLCSPGRDDFDAQFSPRPQLPLVSTLISLPSTGKAWFVSTERSHQHLDSLTPLSSSQLPLELINGRLWYATRTHPVASLARPLFHSLRISCHMTPLTFRLSRFPGHLFIVIPLRVAPSLSPISSCFYIIFMIHFVLASTSLPLHCSLDPSISVSIHQAFIISFLAIPTLGLLHLVVQQTTPSSALLAFRLPSLPLIPIRHPRVS